MTATIRSGETGALMHARAPIDRPLPSFEVQAAAAGSLSALIADQIIPQLVVAHAGDAPVARPAAPRPAAIVRADVDTLVALALAVEADGVISHVADVVARGASIDAVLVDLLAPAARTLGEYWESDRCDFVAVTMALWRLQEVVHDLAVGTPPPHGRGADGRRALFAAMPGEQHGFGTIVIDEVFRRAHWQTDRLGDPTTSELLHRVGGEWFDLVGLTVSCDCHIGAAASLVAAVRSVSANPRVVVLVGGRVFGGNPALAADVGADGTAPDARLALALADRLVGARIGEALPS